MGLAVIRAPIPSSILVGHYQNKDSRDRIFSIPYATYKRSYFWLKKALKKTKQNKTKQTAKRKKNYAEGDDLEDNL